MKDTAKKRKYNSSRRKEQARQTRHQIAEAAYQLFIERGYFGATIEAIAQEAGVAPETIYATFGSKHKLLLFLLNFSIGGDDQPIGILDRPNPQTILKNSDQRQQIAHFSEDIANVLVRVGPIFQIIRTAAKLEPEIEEMLQNILEERLKILTVLAENIANHGPLRKGLEPARAGEIIWAMTSPELFQLFTNDRNWSREMYSQWLADTLTRLLLP